MANVTNLLGSGSIGHSAMAQAKFRPAPATNEAENPQGYSGASLDVA